MAFSKLNLVTTDSPPAQSASRGADALALNTLNSAMTAKSQYVVLLVDDSEVDRLTYQRYAFLDGDVELSFIEAECGESGLALCQQHTPDLILLDYMLPDCDGLEFLLSLQESMPTIPPVIMLTGEGNEKGGRGSDEKWRPRLFGEG